MYYPVRMKALRAAQAAGSVVAKIKAWDGARGDPPPIPLLVTVPSSEAKFRAWPSYTQPNPRSREKPNLGLKDGKL